MLYASLHWYGLLCCAYDWFVLLEADSFVEHNDQYCELISLGYGELVDLSSYM